MEFLVKTKVGDNKALKKMIVENYHGKDTPTNYVSVNIDTCIELHEFMRVCGKTIDKEYITPVICPLEDNTFELRFE